MARQTLRHWTRNLPEIKADFAAAASVEEIWADIERHQAEIERLRVLLKERENAAMQAVRCQWSAGEIKEAHRYSMADAARILDIQGN